MALIDLTKRKQKKITFKFDDEKQIDLILRSSSFNNEKKKQELLESLKEKLDNNEIENEDYHVEAISLNCVNSEEVKSFFDKIKYDLDIESYLDIYEEIKKAYRYDRFTVNEKKNT